MVIPNVELFNELLASLTLDPFTSGPDIARVEVVPSLILSDASRLGASEPGFLWYKRSTLAIESLFERVSKELANRHHFSSIDAAKNVIAMVCLAVSADPPSSTRLNAFLDAIAPADTSQFFIAAFPRIPIRDRSTWVHSRSGR
jgi:hypothetical protein